MQRNEHSVEIARPASDVFPWLVDADKRVRWVDGLEASEQLDPGEPGVGTRFRETMAVPGYRLTVEVTIERLEPAREVAIHTTGRGFEARAVNRTEERDGGTRLTATLETDVKGLAGRVVGGIVGRQAQRSLEQSLATLKRLLETP